MKKTIQGDRHFSCYGPGMYLAYKSKRSTGDFCKQELAADIAGEWLKDPINGPSNFQLKLKVPNARYDIFLQFANH